MCDSKPSDASSRSSVDARRRFWKTPPERHTVRTPVRARASASSSRVTSAIVSWNAAASAAGARRGAAT